jgi:hypothetical protein
MLKPGQDVMVRAGLPKAGATGFVKFISSSSLLPVVVVFPNKEVLAYNESELERLE